MILLPCHVGILERLPAAFVRRGCGLRREEAEKIESSVLWIFFSVC